MEELSPINKSRAHVVDQLCESLEKAWSEPPMLECEVVNIVRDGDCNRGTLDCDDFALAIHQSIDEPWEHVPCGGGRRRLMQQLKSNSFSFESIERLLRLVMCMLHIRRLIHRIDRTVSSTTNDA